VDDGPAHPDGRENGAELSRELDIAPSVIRNWARRPMISVIPPGMASPTMAANPHDLPLRATDDPEQSCALKREALGNGSHEVSPLSAGVYGRTFVG
jgi:hypothetical protein